MISYVRRVIRWVVFGRRVNLLVITYKSGRVVKLRCREYTVTHTSGSNITKMEWTRPNRDPLPIGLENIESIYAS